MLEHSFDRAADRHVLLGITQQITHHSYIAGTRQFHQRGDIRAVPVQRRMHRMPDALIAVDQASTLDFTPIEIEAVATMADPLGAPLPVVASAAELDEQF